MKIKILNLYAVAYSVTLKHCPVGGEVAVINALIKDMCGALYYWCRLVLGCHQRTCHCLRQMSWQKVRHLLILHTRRRMQKRRRHDSKAPGQDRTGQDSTEPDWTVSNRIDRWTCCIPFWQKLSLSFRIRSVRSPFGFLFPTFLLRHGQYILDHKTQNRLKYFVWFK